MFQLMWWNCWQYHPDDDYYWDKGSSGGFVKKMFSMPLDAGQKFRFKMSTTSAAMNPEVRKQTVQHLMGILQPAEQQLQQTIQSLMDPGMAPALRELTIEAARRQSRQLRQIAEAFELPGATQLVTDFDEFWAKNEAGIMQQIQQAQQNPQPEPLDPTTLRKIGPDWLDLAVEVKAEVLKRTGLPVPPDMAQEIERRKAEYAPQQGAAGGPPQGPDGGPPVGPEGGAAQPPPPM